MKKALYKSTVLYITVTHGYMQDTCRMAAPDLRDGLWVQRILVQDPSFLTLSFSNLDLKMFTVFAVGNESVPKIIINDTIKLFFLNRNQHFGYFKPQQLFPSAV